MSRRTPVGESGQRESQEDDGQRTYSVKADFVAKVVEATNAILGVLVIVVLDEAKAMKVSA